MYLFWLRVAAILYGAASLSAFPAVLYGRPGWQRVCLPTAVGAIFFHFVSLAEMMNSARQADTSLGWMPVGMHEVQSLLGLLVAVTFLLIALRYHTVSFGLFALPLTFLLVLIPAIGADRYTFESALVRSGWIIMHVTAILAAYAALIFSLMASSLSLVQERRLKSKTDNLLKWLPPLATMDQIAGTTLVIGFHAMTVGLLAGSLIAQERVGPGYFLDPKVLLSFGMWLLIVLLLFIRRNTGLRGRRAVYLSGLVIVVVLSVWAANQFSTVHRFTP